MKSILGLLTIWFLVCSADEDAKRLYQNLIERYDNNNVLPINKPGHNLTVEFGSALIRLIDVDEKNQVFTTNLWLTLRWPDTRIFWDPYEFGNITKLHVPIDKLWKPDIVLYNNAAGHPEISILADALVFFDGTVVWKPPAIFKSFCAIDVLYFPYDEQYCSMKFGLWSYTGKYVDMRQLPENTVRLEPDEDNKITQYQSNGMDLSYFYPSDEWELLNLTSRRYEVIYSGCCGSETYIDIRYYFRLQRKPLFYTVNLIIPCVMIAFLTTFVFYLPSQSMKKLTFSISLLVTLTVFFLVLIEMIPPTSLVIPLFAKYLFFTLLLVSISVSISVVTVNLHFRKSGQKMPAFVKWLFLEQLPPMLFMDPLKLDRSKTQAEKEQLKSEKETRRMEQVLAGSNLPPPVCYETRSISPRMLQRSKSSQQLAETMHVHLMSRVIENVHFISDYFKRLEEEEKYSVEWMFVAVVVDRLFLLLFIIANIAGTILIILQAPTLYDTTQPLAIPVATNPLSGDTLRLKKWNLFQNMMEQRTSPNPIFNPFVNRSTQSSTPIH